MLVIRSMHPRWLSNSWLIADRPGGTAVLVDTGGPREAIEAALREHALRLDQVLCTHHHYDHVDHNAAYRAAHGCRVCAHAAELDLVPEATTPLADGQALAVGELEIRALHLPGHTAGQLGFVVNDELLLTGDTLFRGSVGGTRAPGHTSFAELRHSIMERLFALPHSLRVLPGHMEETTLADEWEHNSFVRAWRGVDATHETPCTALGEPARLLLRARDYDGGTKCWVRFDADGRQDVVPGSRVKTP